MNFVGRRSEQLKGERLRLEFTVNNLLLASSSCSCQPLGFSAAATSNVQQILYWLRTIGRSPASINQTLRRPLISVQNCNYFRALCRNEQTCWMFHESQPARDNTCWEVLIRRWCQTMIKLCQTDGKVHRAWFVSIWLIIPNSHAFASFRLEPNIEVT